VAAPQKIACRVDRIVDHGERVYTVLLRPDRQAPGFRAGQFLHLALDPYDPSRFWPESRAFSIASAPSQRDLLRITYSVRGRFTGRMETELVEGRRLWIKMPYGDFVVAGDNVVLFAGGTGITPFTAFIETVSGGSGRSVVLAYGARTSGLLVYRDLIEQCMKKTPSIDVSFFAESAGPPDGSAGGARPVAAGRVAVAPIWARVLRPLEASYYVAGPPAMLQTISADLRSRGVSREQIHVDAWE